MRALIIGCGYAGLPLGAELVKQGHEVFGLRRTASAQGQMEAAGINLLRGDITKPEELAELPSAFDWVVNCVATSGGGAKEYRAVYLQGMRNVIAWLSVTPPKKFVYASSTSVYGQTDGSLVTEESRAAPEAETARVLVETENALLEAAQRGPFPAVILRVAGIYGPGRGYWLKQFLNDEARIEGKGDRFLNMIHRDDVVGAIMAALERGRPGEIYNAVDDAPVTQLACFRWLADALGKPLPPFMPAHETHEIHENETLTAERKRGATNKQVSNRKLKHELAYRFKFPTYREGQAG